MQIIITSQGLSDGHYDAHDTSIAIHERIDNRLTACYRQNYGDDIQVVPALTYQVTDGQVTMIQLTYSIDNPTPMRLEQFRFTCECFYELNGFMIQSENESPRVSFHATDIFDMASLIHALDYLSVSLESILCAVDAHLTEEDAIFSPSGAYILQIPNVPHYRIPEGTLYISPAAARHCSQLQELDIPVEMLFDEGSLHEFPKGLKVKVWETHYDGTPVEEEEDSEDDMPVFDDHEVGYSRDGKILTGCRYSFNDTRYEVSDGVEEIGDFAFLPCRHFLVLSIPRSVRIIGDSIFGNGGQIVIRNT